MYLKQLFNQPIKLRLLTYNPAAAFIVHDLFRTCRSLLSAAGVPGHVAERCLNHKLKGVEGIYDRYDYFDERKKALAKVAELVAPSINGASG
ncbi:hypothetical protein [Marinobacter sp. 1-3A]|uniref:hypothetical protein n=1 Tax=Marinobacter sp. 1-3A TaxID=2582920 RepID=UPI001D0F6394|nr:hypothetical protein [Marinobacter sp. 1-3A]